jgi:hypothetical protein
MTWVGRVSPFQDSQLMRTKWLTWKQTMLLLKLPWQQQQQQMRILKRQQH